MLAEKSYQKNQVLTVHDKIARTGTGLSDDRISGAIQYNDIRLHEDGRTVTGLSIYRILFGPTLGKA